VALGVLIAVHAAGCRHSRWALSDPAYRAKYPEWKADDYALQAKQAVDARHIAGGTGVYLGGAWQSDPAIGGGEIGLFGYPTSWLETRGSLGLVADDSSDQTVGGLNLGLRAQAPSRLAPFAGLGVFGGYSERTEYPPCGCEPETTVDGALAAVYPELGVHFWLSPRLRLTASASYFISTEGRDHDAWLFGFNVGWLNRPAIRNYGGSGPNGLTFVESPPPPTAQLPHESDSR